MFENIVGFFKKLFKKETEEENNKDMAKERLHLVLMQDRANVSADFLDMMKQEIIDVIKKYIDVDESEIDVHLTNKTSDDGTTGPALYANIPIVSIKHSGDIDDETKEKVKEQKIEKDEKEEVVDSQEKTEKEDNKEKIEEKVENKDEKENKEVAKKVNKSNNKKEKNNKDKEKSADDTITEKKDAIIADDKENEEKVELKVEEMDVTDEGEVLNQKEEKTEKKQKKKVEKKEEVKRDNKKTSNKKRK